MQAKHVSFVLSCVFVLVFCICIGSVNAQGCDCDCTNTTGGYVLEYPYNISRPDSTLKASSTQRLRIGLVGAFPSTNTVTMNAIVYQINNDDTILKNTALDMYISITNSTNTGDILESSLFHINSLKVQGLIAGLTATEARNAQLAAKVYSVPMISFMATSYILSNKMEYPYFLRTMASDTAEMDLVIALFQRYKWTQGVIIYSTDDFGNGYSLLVNEAAKANITLVGVSVPVIPSPQDTANTVDNIESFINQRRMRIFIYYSQLVCAQAVRTEMFKRGNTGADFVSILAVPVAGPLIAGIYPSTIDDGAIGMTISSPSNALWQKFMATWRASATMKALYPLQRIPSLITDWLGVDALLTFVHAADTLLNKGYSVEEIKGALFLNASLNTNFEGTTGKVSFDRNGDREGDLALYSIQANRNASILIPVSTLVGYYSSSTKQINTTREFIWGGGSNTIPGDGTAVFLPIIFSADAIKVVFGVLVGICVVVALIIFGVLLFRPLAFQKSGRFYCGVIIFGALLAYAAAFTTLPEPTDALCLAFPWLLGMGFMLLFGCLFLKTWALFQVFRAAEQMKKTTLNPMFIMKILGILILVEAIFMIIWSVVDPPKVELITVAGGRERQHTCGAGNISFWAVFIGYKGFWMLFGAIISFLVRNVRDDYNESAGIGMAVYNCFGITAIALVIGFVLRDTPDNVVIIQNVAIIVAFTATLVLLFSRIVISVFRGKDRYVDNSASNSRRTTNTGSGSGGSSKESGNSATSYPQKSPQITRKASGQVELA